MIVVFGAVAAETSSFVAGLLYQLLRKLLGIATVYLVSMTAWR